jgi:hypothetical protein
VRSHFTVIRFRTVFELFVPDQGRYVWNKAVCVQTGSEAHPASFPLGTVGPFSGGKARPWRDADHSPLSRAEVKNE